jgi:hypothetical protein
VRGRAAGESCGGESIGADGGVEVRKGAAKVEREEAGVRLED